MAKKPEDTPEDTSPASSSSASTREADQVSSAQPVSDQEQDMDIAIWTRAFYIALQQGVIRAGSARRPFPSQIDFSLTYDDGRTVEFVGMRSSSGRVEVFPA